MMEFGSELGIWEVKLAPAPLTFGSVSGAPELLGTQMYGQVDR